MGTYYKGDRSMNLIPRDEVEWKRVKYLKEPLTASPEHATWKYEFVLPEPLASWDVFDYWEKERIASMEKNLKKGDILFDIGTEQGWCNLVYADMVGPENIVLIEPTREFWPNIQAVWDKNYNVMPKACAVALFSDKTTTHPAHKFSDGGWPIDAAGDLVDRNKYQYIHENSEKIPEIKLDDYVKQTGIIPTALTMDVEGAELLILRGSEKTLKDHKPKLFISIHPDLGERDYGITKHMTLEYLMDLGYIGEHLATDHEEHWYFS